MTKNVTPFKIHFSPAFFLVTAFLLGGIYSVYAGTYTSNAVTGNWSDGSSWAGGVAPAGLSSDVIVIVSGANITVTSSTSCGSVTINAAATANSLTINGGVTLNVFGSVTLNSPTAAVSSTLEVGDGTLTCVSIAIPGSATANHIAIVSIATGTINCSGNITFSGSAARAQLTFTDVGIINIQGNLGTGGTFNAGGTGTVNFNGTTAQTAGGYTYYNFNADNPAGVTMAGASTITNLNIGDVTPNSIFSDGGYTVTPASGNVLNLNSGTYNLGSSSAATLWPAWTSPTINTGTTIGYVSGVAQTVSAAPPYQYLTLSGIGTKTVANGTTTILDWNVNSTTTTTNAVITIGGNINGTAAIASSGTIYVAGNWTNTGVLTGTGTVNFNGGSDQAIADGLATATFYNVVISGGQNVTVNSPTTALTLNNFVLTYGNFTAPNALTINGSLTLTSGTFTAGNTITIAGNWTDNAGGFVPGTSVVTFTGNSSSITTANGINDQTFYDIVISKTAGQTLSVNLPSSLTVNNYTQTTGNFSFTQLVTLNINANALLASGTFTAGNINTSNMNINVGGNWTNNDLTPIVPSTSIVTFTGPAQTIAGSVATTFYVLTIADGAGVTLNGSPGIGVTCTSLNVGYGGSGTLNIGAQPVTVTGSATAPNDGITINGGAVLSATSGTITDKWDFNNYGTYTAGTGTVIFSVANIAGNLTKAIIGNDPQFYNLTISGAGAAEILDASQLNPVTVQNNLTLSSGTFNAGAQIYVGGNWSMATGAVFSSNNGLITFNGTGAQLITGTATPQVFYDMEIANTASTVTVNTANLTITDHLNIDNASTFVSAAAGNIIIGNIWENDGGTFTTSNGTVTFNGSTGSSTITTNGNAPNQTFNNITIVTTGGTNVDATPLSSLTINGVFTLTSGGFNASPTMTIIGNTFLNGGTFNANTQLYISGNWNEAVAATFTNNNGLVTFNGGGAQSINGPATSETFYDVEIGNTGTATVSNSLNMIIQDDLTIDAGGTLASGTLATIYIGYQWINNGGTFNPSTGTVNFNGGWYNYITGSATDATFNNLTVTNTDLWLDATALTTLTINGNFDMISGGLNPPVTMTVNGNVVLTAGTFFTPTTVLNVGGNWINNGDGGSRGSFDTYDCSCNSVVNFDGVAAQYIGGTATTQNFQDLTVNKTGNGAAGTLSDSTVTTFNINDNFTLTAGTFVSKLKNSTITVNNSGSPSSFTFTNGTFDISSPSSVVTVNGPGSQTGGNVISGGTFNYFDPSGLGQTIITGSYDTLVFDDNSKTLSPGTINISGVFVPGAGTNYTTTGNTIAFTGNTNQVIPVFNFDGTATGTGYGGLSCTTTKIFGGNLAVNGILWYNSAVGNITLGSMNIVIGPTGSISGAAGPSHMIVENGTGRLIKAFATGAQTYTYPVGPVAGTYTPVTLTFDNVTNAGDVGVTLDPGVVDPNASAPPAPATNWLKAYWVFDPNTTNINFDYYSATVSYQASDYNTNLTAGAGGESTMGAMLWNGGLWLTNALVTGRTALNPTASYITSLGDLTFATCVPLTKTADPSSQYVCVSGTSSVAFSVGVSGTPASYQWYQNGVPITDGGIYSGSHSSQLVITNGTSALNNDTYYCVVTAGCSGTFTSDTAIISTVAGVPSSVISVVAYPPTYHQGDTVVIVATDTSSFPGIQYNFVEAFPQNGTYWFEQIQNTSSDTLILDSVTAYGKSIKSPGVTWLFVYANDACGEVYGDFYPIQVIPPTTSSNPTICGDTDGYISFPGLIPNNLYTLLSWSKNGVPQALITLSTNTNGVLTIPNLGAGTYSNIVLQVLNQGSSSPTAPADPVTLVDPCGGLTAFTVTYNSGTSTLGGAVTVCGGVTNIGLSYGDTGVVYSLYQGANVVATDSPVTPGPFNFNYMPVIDNTYIIKGTVTPNTVSMNGSVTISAGPTAVISNTGLTGCTNPGVTLATTGSNANGGTISSYQWANGSGNIVGATDSSYTATVTGNYSVIITNSNSCSATSSTSSVIVYPNPVATITADTLTGCASPGVILSATGSSAGSGTISSYQWMDSVNAITGATDSSYTAIASGSYSVVLTNSNLCSTTSSANLVTIIPNPEPPLLISADSIICSGDSTQVCAPQGFAAYAWNTGDTGYCTYANQAGGYWVTVTSTYGCNTISSHVNISAYPVSSVAIIAQGDTVSSFGENGYQWYFDRNPIDNATSSYYVATKTGYYAVDITDHNGCQVMSGDVYVIATGITGLTNDNMFEIYPNPVSAELQVKVGGMLLGKEFELYDVCGRTVFSGVITQETSTLHLSLIASGPYILKVNGFVQRFMKQ